MRAKLLQMGDIKSFSSWLLYLPPSGDMCQVSIAGNSYNSQDKQSRPCTIQKQQSGSVNCATQLDKHKLQHCNYNCKVASESVFNEFSCLSIFLQRLTSTDSQV